MKEQHIRRALEERLDNPKVLASSRDDVDFSRIDAGLETELQGFLEDVADAVLAKDAGDCQTDDGECLTDEGDCQSDGGGAGQMPVSV